MYLGEKMSYKFIGVIVLSLAVAAGCSKKGADANNPSAPGASASESKVSHSYAIGAIMGTQFLEQGISEDIKVKDFCSGMEDAVAGKAKATKEELGKSMQEFQASLMKKRTEKREKQKVENAEKGKTFLDSNKAKEGVVTTASGLQYKVLQSGDKAGASPKATDKVKVNYKGTLIDGTEFDSSYARKEPAEFMVGGVIPGWTEVLQLMKAGDKWEVVIPSALAYGENGAGDKIGPNAVLLFEVELLEVKAEKPAAAKDDKAAKAATDKKASATKSK